MLNVSGKLNLKSFTQKLLEMDDENEKIEGWTKLSDLINDNWESMVKYISTSGKLQGALENSHTYFDKLKSLKDFYLTNLNEILKTYKESKHLWFISYPTDWTNHFTKIEYQAWCTIREIGRIVLYPQFPVENYFLDFGNPGLKIGLELDGKDFHNKEKDTKRDKVLKEFGWTIYRISGKEMFRTNYKTLSELNFNDYDFPDIQKHLSYWLLETGDGVIQAIKEIYFEEQIDWEYIEDDEYYDNEDYFRLQKEYIKLCHESLDLHRYC